MTRTRFFGLADRGTAHIPCPRNLEWTARIEFACAAYETALEPLQVLRNKLAGEVGLEPTASALTVRHSATELLANPWSGRVDSNHRPPAPKAGALPLRYALTFQLARGGRLETSID